MKLYEKMNSGVYVIAEMSANHAGKIENAFKIIEEVAELFRSLLFVISQPNRRKQGGN